MKKVTILLHDYWHPRNSIEPMLEMVFPKDRWIMTVTENPKDLMNDDVPNLLVSFKDASEDNRVPTPLWCDEAWTARLDDCVKNRGMGFIAVHCGIADIPEEHYITRNILRGYFITHPPQCEVSFEPVVGNELTDGVPAFTFSKVDEHYQIKITGDTEVLGYTVSQHGKQAALWRHKYGKGRVVGVTPGHSYENLVQPEYVKLLTNCADWCVSI